MKITYVTALVIMLICMLVADRQVVKSERALAKPLHRAMVSVFFVVIFSMIATLSSNKTLALVAQGLHNGASDAMLILLLLFVIRFTGFEHYLKNEGERYAEPVKRLIHLMYSLSLIDTVSLILNAWTGHVFFITTKTYEGHGSVNVFHSTGIAFHAHQAFVYTLGIVVLLALIIKIAKTNNFYRTQYIMMLSFVALAMVVDGANNILKLALDISLFAYIMLGILTYLYSMCYIPHYLTSQVMNIATEHISAGVVCYNSDGECIYANNVAKTFTKEPDSLNKLSQKFLSWLGYDDIREVKTDKMELEKTVGQELHYYDVEAAYMKDDGGEALGTFFMINDRTEDMKRYEQERFLATHDSMTRVYNREYFYYKVRKLLDVYPDENFCMLYSNIKDFKLLNQLFGVSKGNDVLIAFAQTFRDHAGAKCVYGRLTSDHFAVCMPTERFDEKTILGYMDDFEGLIDSESYHIHVYFGVYEIEDKTDDIAVMCDRANMALNKIKGSYESAMAYYTDELMQNALYEKMLTSEFQQAVADDQFKLFLQPQCDYEGRAYGAEGLVRWLHPERGMIPPGQFIEVFERTGLIHRLDRHIWELACKKLVDWQERGISDCYISVNISPTDFYYMDIYKTFTGLVDKYGIAPEKLRLEITETAIMSDFEKNIALINRLQDYGFIVEIDDFGSGYSSLNTLKDMKVDVLKIDMVFLRETQHKVRSRVILRNIINMAHQLNMSVVVEGVETPEQLDFLNELGCEQYQGYYFSKPIPEAEFEANWL
jgi:diguanylate cyclase (GGDEF)-like protein